MSLWIQVVDGHVVLCWKGYIVEPQAPGIFPQGSMAGLGYPAGHQIVGSAMFGKYLIGVHLINL